jgi:predicted Zn-dependent protease
MMDNENGQARPGCGGGGAKLIIALVMAAIAVVSYMSRTEKNPITGENQRVGMTVDQEIALGLQAAPEMAQQFGGEDQDPRDNSVVDQVGSRIVASCVPADNPFKSHFEFHALGDEETINAFALPGGQVFITKALLQRLETEGQLAGVLGHEIGHVLARHGAEQAAKQQLTQGLTGAAVIATYHPSNPASRNSAQVAQMIGALVNMKFSRGDELEADKLGVRFMAETGYDPRAMIGVMKVLENSVKGGNTPEFFSTHPNPENRIEKIQAAIKERYPNGVPSGMKQ